MPLCTFDEKNGITCLQCESKLSFADGIQKIKVITSDERARFPIDIDKVISLAKYLRRIELAVELKISVIL